MNERNRQEDKWEKIVELCEEGHYLSEEELEQWSNDPEALDVCKELLRCKNAVARRFEKCAPKLNGNGFTHGRKMQLPPKRRLLHVSRRITVFYGESRRAWRLRF